MRKQVRLALGGVLVAGLTGCTVPIGGDTGISVDEAGHLIVVLTWCGRSPDAVVVYHDPAPAKTDSAAGTAKNPSVVDADYQAPALGGQSASFRLDAPSGGWTVTPKPLIPDPAITYTAYGATHDNSSSTRSVSFEADDVAKVKPGLVLVQRYDEKKQDDVDVVMSLREFERAGQGATDCD